MAPHLFQKTPMALLGSYQPKTVFSEAFSVPPALQLGPSCGFNATKWEHLESVGGGLGPSAGSFPSEGSTGLGAPSGLLVLVSAELAQKRIFLQLFAF